MENDLSRNDPWLRSPWNTVWAYLSFLSEPRTQAYNTYLKSPFWLNVDTWTEEVFPWENFHNQQDYRLFSSAKKKILINHPPVWDESWIFKCIIGQSKNKKRMKMKKCDSRVKTRKGSLEQKRENFRKLMGGVNRRVKGNDQTTSESSMRSFTLSKTKNLNSSFQNAFPRILESITVGLDACQIAIFKN